MKLLRHTEGCETMCSSPDSISNKIIQQNKKLQKNVQDIEHINLSKELNALRKIKDSEIKT